MRRPGSKKLPAEKAQLKRLNTLARAPKRITRRELETSLEGRMISRRRARKMAISLSAFGLVLLLAVVSVATFSPLLAIKQVSVSGTDRIKPELIAKALEVHLGTPLPLLSEAEIARSLSGFELIESFSATAAPPNGLQVRINERQPICIIKIGTERYLHDPAGIRLGLATGSDILPEIVISENPKGSQRFKNAMEVLMALPEGLLEEVELIEARTKDDVRMTLRNSRNQRIVWGDSSNSALKSKVLQTLMKNNRRTQSVTFDVSSPTAPVLRFDDF